MKEGKNRAVFLDRDGTVIRDYGYNCDINKIEILPNAVQSLRIMQSLGYLLIIITNQSGVARGYFTEEQLKRFNAALTAKLKGEGVDIAAVYYCPHYKHGVIGKYAVRCDCRKPQTGLFMRAAEDFSLDLSKCWAIGNALRDCSISNVSDCKSCLIGGADNISNNNIYAVSGWEQIVSLIAEEKV